MPPVSPLVANALILLTALLLYVLAWVSVGRLPRFIRGIARLALLLILIAPIVVSMTIGTQAPRREAARKTMDEGARRSVEVPSPVPSGGGRSGDGASDTSKRAERPTPPAPPPAPAPSAEPSRPVYKMEVPAPGPTTTEEARPKIATDLPSPPMPPAIAGAKQPGAPGPPAPSPPPVATAESPDWAVVPVFYGTDRKATDETKRLTFGAERAGKLDLGRVLVTVPKAHQVPNIERPWALTVPFFQITIYEQAEDPKKHFTIKEIGRLGKDEFLTLVKARLASSVKYEKQAVVFVHGYNTDFDFAAYRTAQMVYDLDYDGVPFLYSWPSKTGITAYVSDRESAEQAEPYLREFIEMVVRETGAKSVSVIAHSMGNLPLLRVLKDIGPRLPDGVKLDQIVLAAPDVDRNVFEQLARDLDKIGAGVTLYASSTDRAMDAARRVAGGVPRAGDVPPGGPVIMPGIDTIDITSVSTDALALNHSSYAERSALLNDIGLILRTRERPPEKRIPILERVTIDRGAYWRYPAQR